MGKVGYVFGANPCNRLFAHVFYAWYIALGEIVVHMEGHVLFGDVGWIWRVELWQIGPFINWA
jgi:hypothetical protein